MRNSYIFVLLFITCIGFAQAKFSKESVVAFQKQLNAEYADKEKSPLLAKDLKKFKGLDFYAPDEKFFVTAKFVRTENEKPFEMPTSTDRRPMYIKYGEIVFTLSGKEHKMNVYRSLDLAKMEKYKNDLFLPFTDLTSGNQTYGGGRYIDLKIPTGNTLVIDFNQSYNPYCAYNHKYSCPVPPDENFLKTEIKAGVKKFHD